MKQAQQSGAFSTEVGKRPGWRHEGIGRSNELPIVARVQRGGWPVFATVSRIRDSIGTGRQHSAPRTDVSEINAIVDGLNPRSILSFGCRSGSGIATSSEAARLPAHSHSGLCLRRSLNGDSWMSQGAPSSGETGPGTGMSLSATDSANQIQPAVHPAGTLQAIPFRDESNLELATQGSRYAANPGL